MKPSVSSLEPELDAAFDPTPPLEREGIVRSRNIISQKLILISKYRDNSILRDEVVANSSCGNTDSQHLLAGQQATSTDHR